MRVLLRREHQLVVEKVGLRIGGASGFTDDAGDVWATKVDGTYTLNGRMPPNTGEVTWHDFTIDILGGATGLLYATGYRDVDGIIIPATRRGYAWQGDYQLVPEPLLVAIDMGEIIIR